MRNARCFILLIVLLAAHAQDTRRPIELADYYAIEEASAPAISPDGKRVAFVRNYIIEAENRRHSEIWLAPSDGSDPARRITNPAFSATNPRWSPDGKLLAFASRRQPPCGPDCNNTWFLPMAGEGGEAFQVPGVTSIPVFSPDNRWMAFMRRTPPPGKPPERAPLTEFERRIEQRFKGRAYHWMNVRSDGEGYRPDPRDPRATPPSELYVIERPANDIHAGEWAAPRQLTRLGVNVQSAAWSADSRRLAFVADSHQRDEHSYERADLWTVDLAGAIARLTDDGYNHRAPSWSPDGKHLVFLRSQSINQIVAAKQAHGSPVDIYRMPAAGGSMQNLTADFDLIPEWPGFSPDGESVWFSAAVGGDRHLFRLSPGGKIEQVASRNMPVFRLSPGGIQQIALPEPPARSITSLSLSAAHDRVAFAASDSTHPGEVFAARIAGNTLRDEKKLSAFNDALLARVALRPAERIRFPSDDGTMIEGWVVLPPGYDAARGPYPLILSIHGGPHGAYGNGFPIWPQLIAAQGHIALYTNPRGSTGYGEKFLWATWGGWGVLDYQDVMSGVKYALGRYAVDRARLGVTGYSYGGFLTNWTITQTDRFAAAVSGAGVSNWISDYGTADIPRTKETEFFGPPWEERSGALLLKQSPVTWAGRVRTPTLFLHGENDFRVPIEQAEQMYTALKKRRVPARFVRYDGMSHGGWPPWNMVHRLNEEMKWWKTHLKAAPPGR